MKFLIDEDISPRITTLLHRFGYSAIHIREIQISLGDSQILEIAGSKNYIVITEDKDFGLLVFKNRQPHSGVILLRLKDQTLENTKNAIKWLLPKYENRIEDNFTTLTEKKGKLKVRFKEKKISLRAN